MPLNWARGRPVSFSAFVQIFQFYWPKRIVWTTKGEEPHISTPIIYESESFLDFNFPPLYLVCIFSEFVMPLNWARGRRGGYHGGTKGMREWKNLRPLQTKVDISRWTMKNEFYLSHASYFVRDWNIPTWIKRFVCLANVYVFVQHAQYQVKNYIEILRFDVFR